MGRPVSHDGKPQLSGPDLEPLRARAPLGGGERNEPRTGPGFPSGAGGVEIGDLKGRMGELTEESVEVAKQLLLPGQWNEHGRGLERADLPGSNALRDLPLEVLRDMRGALAEEATGFAAPRQTY